VIAMRSVDPHVLLDAQVAVWHQLGGVAHGL
jgi:hypothetical protein